MYSENIDINTISMEKRKQCYHIHLQNMKEKKTKIEKTKIKKTKIKKIYINK